MELFDLSGKAAIVTGGGGGIGLGMARGLASAGAALALVDRDADKLAAAQAELEGLGATAVTVQADVTDSAQVARMVGEAAAALGRVDILFNNAGITVPAPADELSEEDWHDVLNTNLTSAFLCSKACYPEFLKAGGGKIVNTGSIMSFFSLPHSPVYSASKGGIVQLTKSLATAWAKNNIQVNCINPGFTHTDLTRAAIEKIGRQDFVERVTARTPAGRWGQPDDFRGAAVFLASAAADFISGAALVVDGGYSAVG